MPTPEREFTAQGAMFEGLFLRGPPPDEALLRELREGGYDHSAPRNAYPIAVWVHCMDVLWRRRHPALERFPAWTAIGRTFIEGYFETFIGRLIAVTLPFMSPRRFLDRVPNYMRTGLKETLVDVDWTGPTSVVITIDGATEGSAHIMVGVLDVCLQRLGVLARFEAIATGLGTSRLTVTW